MMPVKDPCMQAAALLFCDEQAGLRRLLALEGSIVYFGFEFLD